ncbi:MAG TPA: M28 family peptidase [Thermoleophilaceae bacterium]|nr:M28 family peptidase [Thermoleophilaceae bacterium]
MAATVTAGHRLREVIEELAPLERGAGMEGEREAAELLRARFDRMGVPVAVDEEEFDDGYARLHALFSATGLAAGLLASRGRARPLAAAAGLAAGLASADDSANGARFVRRAIEGRSTTWNVVAEAGDRDAERTLVVMAHHDAAPTGFIFDDTLQRKLNDWFPDLIERTDTALPMWWPVYAGPLLAALGAVTGRRGLARTGGVMSALSAISFADIARHRIVPGASDNLSGVAVLVGLTERLAAKPVTGLRVVLASCGAEEVLQGGVYGFVERHLRPLDPDSTWVLNVDTVGSPRLILLEGEGPIWMEDYCAPEFRDLVAEVAADAGIALRRNMRARTSTDAVITSRAGYPTATLCSMNAWKGLSNYHKPTDVPENVDYGTVEAALGVAEAVTRRLAA